MKGAGRTLALRRRPRRQAPSSGFSRAAPQRPRGRSSRKALAAAGAARVQHLAASDRLHARAKAVAAFANELARLIGPLHVINSKSWEFTGQSALGFPNKPTPDLAAPLPRREPRCEPGKCLAAAAPSRGGAYKRAPRAKSIGGGVRLGARDASAASPAFADRGGAAHSTSSRSETRLERRRRRQHRSGHVNREKSRQS